MKPEDEATQSSDPITSNISYRLQSDKRQLGGLLMILGFCAIIAPATEVVSAFGPNGLDDAYRDPSTIEFWLFVGALCMFINGVFSVFVGYLTTVHDWSHRYLTFFVLITVQTVWIYFITYIPLMLDGTNRSILSKQNVNVTIFVFGLVTVFTYGFAFVGSIASMVWSLHKYNAGNPEHRTGIYFQRRLRFYSLILALAGLAQAGLGVLCVLEVGPEQWEYEPVITGFLLVTKNPSIVIVVGAIQFLNGVWGVARGFGVCGGEAIGNNDISFPLSMAVQWILVLVLQIMFQFAYASSPGSSRGWYAPNVLALSLALNLMPAFLDHKMRIVPDHFPSEYYSLGSNNANNDNTDGSNPSETRGVTVEEVDIEAPPVVTTTEATEASHVGLSIDGAKKALLVLEGNEQHDGNGTANDNKQSLEPDTAQALVADLSVSRQGSMDTIKSIEP